jgi:hypothetical protein
MKVQNGRSHLGGTIEPAQKWGNQRINASKEGVVWQDCPFWFNLIVDMFAQISNLSRKKYRYGGGSDSINLKGHLYKDMGLSVMQLWICVSLGLYVPISTFRHLLIVSQKGL